MLINLDNTDAPCKIAALSDNIASFDTDTFSDTVALSEILS